MKKVVERRRLRTLRRLHSLSGSRGLVNPNTIPYAMTATHLDRNNPTHSTILSPLSLGDPIP